MPFLRSSTRPQAVECFFCLSPSVLPPQVSVADNWHGHGRDRKGKGRADIGEVGTKWNWHCARCGCWNIRDESGEMRSDHPAMYSSSLNSRSFSLRASPSNAHFPSASPSSSSSTNLSTPLFCRNCLANQTIITNILANYLPADDDPAYPALWAGLRSYLASLHARYPPVCPACQPGVDRALRKADQRAQTEAWSSALMRGRVEAETEAVRAVQRGWRQRVARKVYGAVWWLGLGLSLARRIVGVAPESRHRLLRNPLPVWHFDSALLGYHLLSWFWIVWEPPRLRRVPSGHRGRHAWKRDMLIIYFMRVLASLMDVMPRALLLPGDTQPTHLGFALLELAVLLHAHTTSRPPDLVPLQLVRPVPLSSGPSPVSSPHSVSHVQASTHAHESALAALSLTPAPLAPLKHNPIFGESSLSSSYHRSAAFQREDMDWEPTPPPALYNGGYTSFPPGTLAPGTEDEDAAPDHLYSDTLSPTKRPDWDNFGRAKQRFFAKAKEGDDETGLEGLLAGWDLGGKDQQHPVKVRDRKMWSLSRWFKREKED